MLEAFQQTHSAAADQPAVQAVAEGVNMEQGQPQQEAVCFGDLPASDKTESVGDEVVVSENGALRCTGCPRGVNDARGGVAIKGGRGAMVCVRCCGGC